MPARNIRARCRAASSSAWHWRVRWPLRPACCCSMSRCRPWMPRCASGCAARSGNCSGGYGVTTIMVTHDQEEALSMADRVVVMNEGVIEQVGSPSDVYERPATPFVADFLGKVNVLKGVALGGGRYRVGATELDLPVDGHRDGQRLCAFMCGPRTAMSKAMSRRCPNRLRGRDRSHRLSRHFLPGRAAQRSAGSADADFVLAQSAARSRRARRR